MATALLIAALILFVIEFVRSGFKSAMAAGLACWVASVLFGIHGLL